MSWTTLNEYWGRGARSRITNNREKSETLSDLHQVSLGRYEKAERGNRFRGRGAATGGDTATLGCI